MSLVIFRQIGIMIHFELFKGSNLIIVPKNYHDDIKRTNKTIEVIIQDIDIEE
jgi:hypothetical protein